jgi:hypothetical protein
MLSRLSTGTLLLRNRDAAGSFSIGGSNDPKSRRLVILDDTSERCYLAQLPRPVRPRRSRLYRQTIAIGPEVTPSSLTP